MRGKPKFPPKICVVCGKEFNVGKGQGRPRHSVTCSMKCATIHRDDVADKYWEFYGKKRLIKRKIQNYRRRIIFLNKKLNQMGDKGFILLTE